MDVGESMRRLTVDVLHALDPVQMGMVWESVLEGGVLPTPSSPNVGTLWVWLTVAITSQGQPVNA